MASQIRIQKNILYKPDLSIDRGTLTNICIVFHLKGVKQKVAESFNHVKDMVHLVTKGLVVIIAMELPKLHSAHKISNDDEDLMMKSLIKYLRSFAVKHP